MWKIAPLAPCLFHIQQGVDDFAQLDFGVLARPAIFGQQWFDEFPLLVGEVTRIRWTPPVGGSYGHSLEYSHACHLQQMPCRLF